MKEKTLFITGLVWGLIIFFLMFVAVYSENPKTSDMFYLLLLIGFISFMSFFLFLFLKNIYSKLDKPKKKI